MTTITACINGKITASTEILARLDMTVPYQAAKAFAVLKVEKEGERYSLQSSDVLADAARAIGQSTVPAHEQGYINAMLAWGASNKAEA